MFKFRLQTLLDIRQRDEEESERAFRTAQMQKNQVEHRLNELKANYKKYSKFKAGESVIERKIKYTYLTAINYSINEATKDLLEKEKLLEEARKELQLKQRDRKTVEILKEKQLYSFNKEQQMLEQKTNDEFALYAFMRTRALKGGEKDER